MISKKNKKEGCLAKTKKCLTNFFNSDLMGSDSVYEIVEQKLAKSDVSNDVTKAKSLSFASISRSFTESRVTDDVSLYLFSRKNPFRQFLIKIMLSRTFEVVIMLFIMFSALALAFENPLNNPDGM